MLCFSHALLNTQNYNIIKTQSQFQSDSLELALSGLSPDSSKSNSSVI